MFGGDYPAVPTSDVKLQFITQSNILFGRDTSFTRLHRWIDECTSTHQSCSMHTSSADRGSIVRPTRLLDLDPIQQGSESGIRLIETRPDRMYQYACLSHRWDETIQCHQATKHNLPRLLNFFPIKQLPQNFRDAISIARELDIRYLWIDSLCIIQEGDGGVDLIQELGKMGLIYWNAWLTIAAISSPNSSDGCFIKDKWPDLCFSVSNTLNESYFIGARVLDKEGKPQTALDIEQKYPLATRGWAFQEYWLSPRLLQCNYGEFTFRCLESSHCECNSSMAPHPEQPINWLGKQERLSWDLQEIRKHDAWSSIVCTYRSLNLTYPNDVLPAIAGYAQILAPRLKFNYAAGLWEERVATELLWFIDCPSNQLKPRPRDSTAPSWSWASVAMGQDTRCAYNDAQRITKTLLIDGAIQEIHCEPESSDNPFDKLKYGYLKFNTTLYMWYIRWLCLEAKRSGGYKNPFNRFAWDFHFKKPTNIKICAADLEALEIEDTFCQVYFDARVGKEELKNYDIVGQCTSPGRNRCQFAQIHLLHALHDRYQEKTINIFLMLKRIPPIHGKPNCYQRVGLLKTVHMSANSPPWEEMISGTITPCQEEFWLF
ncbi:heterokaryon incompatibility protein-domain-containing protein [Annulohypoxylon maeteangense]|uniref:heterokaryon incompatibility protein-domain-containing protein n=1 Tax=Annulohypoxylon maeteangense TaxID=1927788 RepID=UPI002007E622|nr:heterokaryon incompatibility protein-domain-containing protein [Annulohypoxylon maeteangense]KAI0887866.1 heterokaryon incompatibility protein-domain-containing protein [Annulohypoxylon maeteangense]